MYFERAAECGDTEALRWAGDRLAGEGRLDEALTWAKRAADNGNTAALHRAADNLVMADRLDDALTWYERAAVKGDTNALQVVANQLAIEDRKEESLAWFQRPAIEGQGRRVTGGPGVCGCGVTVHCRNDHDSPKDAEKNRPAVIRRQHLVDDGGVLVIDDTGFIKKGTASAEHSASTPPRWGLFLNNCQC
ncbi:hypothetical protein [Streptomyces sp. NPDC001250]|uniref:hypothetical protein n=1 Tax=unclassified Streptomyces TaxID=2593676 RepID=UPI003324B93C